MTRGRIVFKMQKGKRWRVKSPRQVAGLNSTMAQSRGENPPGKSPIQMRSQSPCIKWDLSSYLVAHLALKFSIHPCCKRACQNSAIPISTRSCDRTATWTRHANPNFPIHPYANYYVTHALMDASVTARNEKKSLREDPSCKIE